MIVLDAGRTLGTFEPPRTVDMLAALSPLSKDEVRAVSRRLLHCTPEPFPEVLGVLCEALRIDHAALPDPWPVGRFSAYPYAREVVRVLKKVTGAPAVVLSNIPCTSGPGRMRDLREQLHPYIGITYTSYTLGMRKPDPRLWRLIAENHGVTIAEIVHIGDEWDSDVEGAIDAGCRAIHVATRDPAPPISTWPAGPDRVGTAGDLRGAIEIVRRWHDDVH